MKDCNYIPNGTLQGDTRPLPDRGTSAGMNGDTYGADLSPDATNRIVGIAGACKSDPWQEDMSDDPTFGQTAEDAAEDAAE